MPGSHAFEYAVVRVVPRVDREEFINVGVVVFCYGLDYLDAVIELDPGRLRALAPWADVEEIERHLAAIPRVCAGGPGAGPLGSLPPMERWRWLVAPRSTVVQTSAAHPGLCDDPAGALDRLMDRAVRPPRADSTMHDDVVARVLDAADPLGDDATRRLHPTLTVRAFYPSLHLNLAENHRRLGHTDQAREHLRRAEVALGALDEQDPGLGAALDDLRARLDADEGAAPAG